MSNNVVNNDYEIDADIRELIEFCNINGIKTLASCSGTQKDHKGESDIWGQLNVKDSKLSRKIAAVIIQRGICKVDLISKPMEKYELYDNIISYPHINFSFKNLNNEVLPKIVEAIHQVIKKKVEPNEEIMDKVNQVFDFFNSIDKKISSTYTVTTPGFAGELTFNNEYTTRKMRVDKEKIVENIVNLTGKPQVDYGYYLGVLIEGDDCLKDTLKKVKTAVKRAPKISINEESQKDRDRETRSWQNYICNNGDSSTQQCRTSQPLELLLGQVKPIEESILAEPKLSNIRDDIIVEPWDKL